MDIETIADQVRQRIAGSGFDRSVKLDLAGAGSLLIDGATVSTEGGEGECTIAMSAENFAEMVAGDLDPTSAFMSGKMKIDGDMSAAMAPVSYTHLTLPTKRIV